MERRTLVRLAAPNPLVVQMDEEEFEMLYDILKILEKEDLKDHVILEAMTEVIDSFQNQLSTSQKVMVDKEFIKYKRIDPRTQISGFRGRM